MEINSLLFAFLFLVYSGFSFYTFLITTDGSASWGEFLVNPPPMLLNAVIVVVGAVVRRQYFCPTKLFYFLILVIGLIHLACLVFNSGNISPASGAYAFYYETVLAGRPGVFGMRGQFPQQVQSTVRFYLRIAYYASILTFLIYLIRSRR